MLIRNILFRANRPVNSHIGRYVYVTIKPGEALPPLHSEHKNFTVIFIVDATSINNESKTMFEFKTPVSISTSQCTNEFRFEMVKI